MDKLQEYFERKEAEERAKREMEAVNRLMEIHEEVAQANGITPPEPPEPQSIDEAIQELKEALK